MCVLTVQGIREDWKEIIGKLQIGIFYVGLFIISKNIYAQYNQSDVKMTNKREPWNLDVNGFVV